jgi:plastocyanin
VEADTAPPGAVTITIDGLKFLPDELTVKAGTVVFFLDTTAGLYPHNMLIGAGPAEGPPLATSQTLSETQSAIFTVHDLPPGTYTFWCSLRDHVLAGMKGTLTVTD